MTHNPIKRSRRAGFSLLELMLVVAIIGVLSAIAAVAVSYQGEKVKKKATYATMQVIKNALDQYKLEKNSYPTSLMALQAGTTPYLDPLKPVVDGWSQAFLYQTPGSGGRDFDLISKGSDGKYPSQDDLNFWNPSAD